jgi:superfamily I DNA/RNA helicase
MTGRPTLAMSSDFLHAYARLPRAEQKRVSELFMKFNNDPESPGLNYERINAARDPNMRSLRLSQGYRAIVAAPETGAVHLLLWADKHDDAYDWAERHMCSVNAETGALQIYAPVDSGAAADVAPQQPTPDETSAFYGLKDRELQRLGVPETMLPEVRHVANEDALDAMQPRLPVEAYESLFLYLAGTAYEDLILEREALKGDIDTQDFSAALARLESRARFVAVSNESEFEEILNAPLERWRVFLHPSQRRLVERDWNGPVRVLGGAGTGKTVVAMHRARWLAEHLPGEDRILFTTFTRNLATDIEQNLRTICTPEQMQRIEVINLDRWVSGFLRGQRYEFQIVMGRDKDAWDEALGMRSDDLDLPEAFYSDEWEQVVQANGVTSVDEYKRVPRTGRGTRLNRADRIKVWNVFDEYRAILAERKQKEADDAYRDATALLGAGRARANYACVIVDEAQDMGAQAYRLLRAIVEEGKNDMFIVGDGHQRIYGRNKVVLSRCGVNIRGRSRKLRLNYRTTEETRRWAVGLLEGREIDDLDGGADNNKDFKSLTHGPEPHLEHFDNAEQQARFIVDYVNTLTAAGESTRGICIVCRRNAERNAIRRSLEAAGVATLPLDAGTADATDTDGVRLATMHRVKGLEFDRMIMASINEGLVPLSVALDGKGDKVSRIAAETEERALLYVAATRAKRELLVLSHGRASRFVRAQA